MSKTYHINPNQNIEVQFLKATFSIVADHTSERIRTKVTKDVDREIQKIFKHLARILLNQRSNAASPPKVLQEYTPPWAAYTHDYKVRKRRIAGHSRWFIHGFPHDTSSDDREGEEQLTEEFQGISGSQVRSVVGDTRVIVRRDKTGITLKMLPKTNLKIGRYEDNFRGVLSDIAWQKLRNRDNKYRALVGPMFVYFLGERIPEIIRNSLRSL